LTKDIAKIEVDRKVGVAYVTSRSSIFRIDGWMVERIRLERNGKEWKRIK
jgi:hypothetical protein